MGDAKQDESADKQGGTADESVHLLFLGIAFVNGVQGNVTSGERTQDDANEGDEFAPGQLVVETKKGRAPTDGECGSDEKLAAQVLHESSINR
jgi:hypothetical protein